MAGMQPDVPGPAPTPAFLVTIDTEGDNLWSRPRQAATRNARCLPRFQALCERHGLKPAYLVNHEMAMAPFFRDFGRDLLARRAGEIGMHLHAWNSPPAHPLDDPASQPFITEYPPAAIRDKCAHMTALLAETFGQRPLSHRAGRWAFDAVVARTLIELGYRVDCSVTPLVDWRATRGLPGGHGGQDYRAFPDTPYLLDPNDPARPGRSPLLELPMTILPRPHGPWRRALNRLRSHARPEHAWLRPSGRNLRIMLALLEEVLRSRRPHAMFMLHSSELMAGGSPNFKTDRDIERLYEHLERLFAAAQGRFAGKTLMEFAEAWTPVP